MNISVLRKCDRLVRCRVRQWLSLPSDVPNVYIHANVKNGGLGIIALRWYAALKLLQRLEKLPLADAISQNTPGIFLRGEIKKCRDRLLDNEQPFSTSSEIRNRWAQQLYGKVDGKGLRESVKVLQQHIWGHDGTRFVWT